MRLLVASGIFHPEAGGPATYLYEVLPALQARGWDVRVLTFGEGDTTGYPYPVRRIPRGVLPLRYARYALASTQMGRGTRVVYQHTLDLPLVGVRAPRVLKVVGDPAWERCIRKGWIAPTLNIDDFQTHPMRGIVGQQQASRNRQVRAMTQVIVPSVYLKQMVLGWGVPEERVRVIYNALPPAPAALPSREEARAALGLSDERITLLTAARLTPWKGVDYLIQAVARLPEYQLLVAGDGEELARLQALAAPLGERVRFLGRLPRETLYHAMRAADYFALYSGYEGLAHTLLESLRVGTPLIASAKGGNVEVVVDGRNGLLVPFADLDALTDTLRRAADRTLWARLAAQTAHGLERFTFDHMVEATHAALQAAL